MGLFNIFNNIPVFKNLNNFSDEKGMQIFNVLYSLISESIIPAAYIPFLNNKDDDSQVNFKNVYNFGDGVYNDNKKLQYSNNLENTIKNINKPEKCYNTFKIDNLLYFCIFSWIVIFSIVLKWIYYYYKNIFVYILIVTIIILLVFAVIFKMMMTLN
jgi:hypothetical protein